MKTLDEYQQLTLTTKANDLDDKTALATWALGVAGEAGEVADLIKKVIGHNHPLDKEKVAKELGDVLWYVSVMANQLGFTLSEIALRNINKLKDRYPNGFSTEQSLNRKE